MAEQQTEEILQQYPQARAYLAQTLEQEAEAKIIQNQKMQLTIKQKIEEYNQAVNGLNSCIESISIYEHQLPVIEYPELVNKDSNYSEENNGDRANLESVFATTEI